MKIFIDTADLSEIENSYALGIVDGITTNPSLMKKAMSKYKVDRIDKYIDQILNVAGKDPVSLEVEGGDYESMKKQALRIWRRFKRRRNNVVIKVPINSRVTKGSNEFDLNFDALKLIKTLSDKKIPVNCTLVFTPEQALLAAKAGAIYVSPFAGRIDDMLRNQAKVKFEKSDYFDLNGLVKRNKIIDDNGVVSGIDLISQIREIFDNYGFETQILSASIRNARQARECAIAGSDVATLPPSILLEMINHKKTEEGMKKFNKDTIKEYRDLLNS